MKIKTGKVGTFVAIENYYGRLDELQSLAKSADTLPPETRDQVSAQIEKAKTAAQAKQPEKAKSYLETAGEILKGAGELVGPAAKLFTSLTDIANDLGLS